MEAARRPEEIVIDAMLFMSDLSSFFFDSDRSPLSKYAARNASAAASKMRQSLRSVSKYF